MTSSESLKAQWLVEPDPELRRTLGLLWREAVVWEAEQLLAVELGATPMAQFKLWPTVESGLQITGWFEAVGIYSQQHHVHQRVRDISWCGRLVPTFWAGCRPLVKLARGRGCVYCVRRTRRWVVWGETG